MVNFAAGRERRGPEWRPELWSKGSIHSSVLRALLR
jgi:hypothetical protein